MATYLARKNSSNKPFVFFKTQLAYEDVSTEIRELESSLKQLFEQQLEGAKIRSRVK